MTQGWLYYCVAKWSQFGVEWKRGPMKKLRELRPDLPDGFACFPVILLEEVVMVGAVEGVVDPKSWTDFRPSLESVPAVSLSLCHFSSNSSGVR